MSRITSIATLKARRLADNALVSLTDKVKAIRLKHRMLTLGKVPNEYRKLPNKVARRVDASMAAERLATVRQQDIDPLIRRYRILAALPYFGDLEGIVRWIGRSYGVDDAELWADVLDNIAGADDSIVPIPEDKRHTLNLFAKTARLMASTGKYRTNRIRSKSTLPIKGLERQEKSPSYNPYISAKGQSLPGVSADRVHYIGHKAPGNPTQNAFRFEGRIDLYLRSLGLDKLSQILNDNVRWVRNNGANQRGHFTINWSQAAKDYGCKTDHQRKQFKQKVLELLGEYDHINGRWNESIPEEFCRHNGTVIAEKQGWTIRPFHDYRGETISEIGRKVGSSEWRTRHVRKAELVDHYLENPDCKCLVCQEIRSDIRGWAITNGTLLTDWFDHKTKAN